MGNGAESKDAYAAMMYSNMSAQDKANWYLQTGQTSQAKAYQTVALAQSAGNLGLASLQAGIAYNLESAPGVAPPPFTGRVGWTADERSAREEQMMVQARAAAAERVKRRTAADASSESRTSAGAQERAVRAEASELRGQQEAARAQVNIEESRDTAIALKEKHAAEQAQFKYRVEQRERERQAKLNLLAAGGQIVGKAMTTAANVIPGAMAQRQANVAAAGQYGMTVGEYKTGQRQMAKSARLGRKMVGMESKLAELDPTSPEALAMATRMQPRYEAIQGRQAGVNEQLLNSPGTQGLIDRAVLDLDMDVTEFHPAVQEEIEARRIKMVLAEGMAPGMTSSIKPPVSTVTPVPAAPAVPAD